MESVTKTIKELEVVSDDEDHDAFPSPSNPHLANADHSDDNNKEPTYRVAWDSSQSRIKPTNSASDHHQTATNTSSPSTAKAEELKEQGNAAYKSGNDTTALEFYQKALQHCSNNTVSSETKPIVSPQLQATLYSNIAAVYLRLNRPSDAITAAKQAHALLPTWTRPLHRLAEAYLLLGKYLEAVQACQKGEILCHNNRNSEGHTEFTPVLDKIALKSASTNTVTTTAATGGTTGASVIVGFTGRQLEVRSAGDEAWLGRPAPHIPELDGPLNEESALPSDDLTTSISNTNSSTTKALPSSVSGTGISSTSKSTKNISARSDSLATWQYPEQESNTLNPSHGHFKDCRHRTSFRCIQEAISAAHDGDRILLLRGVHNGMGQSININKRVLIEGQGDLGETVIDQRANCPTFRITRGGVVIRNLDIDHTGFREAFLIEGKPSVAPLIENCILKCSGDDVVNTAGSARPFFRRCVITGKKCGIRAFEKAHVTLESCIVEKCGEQALKAMENSKIDATLCTLRDSEEDGIVVMDNATVSLLACTIQGNEGPGVDCSGQGKLEIRGGEISKNDGGGIFLWDASTALLDGARLNNSGTSPVILADEKGRVHATSCMIKGTIHASEEAWQGIYKKVENKNLKTDGGGGDKRVDENVLKNKLIGSDGPKLFPAEEGPFRFVPNRYTRKQ